MPFHDARAQTYGLGINDSAIWRTIPDQEIAFARHAEAGTRFIRTDAIWSALEPSKGNYRQHYLDRLDHFFSKCTEANIRVLLIPAYAPEWANGGNKGTGYAPIAEHLGDYADFCEFLLRRYAAASYINKEGKRTLEAIEIWNEPDLSDLFFKPYARNSAAGATAYGNIVVAAGNRLKKVRAEIGASDVLVCAPVLADVHSVCWAPAGQTTWMDAFYAVKDVTAAYDVFSWHSYWQSAGSTGWLPTEMPSAWSDANQHQAVVGKLSAPGASRIWAKMSAHGDDKKPNWLTEIGGATRAATPQHKPERLISFEEQKAHLADVVAVMQAGKVKNLARVYWFSFFDNPSAKDGEQVFGLFALNDSRPIAYDKSLSLVEAKLSPKPAYEVYKSAAKTGAQTGSASTPPVVVQPVVAPPVTTNPVVVPPVTANPVVAPPLDGDEAKAGARSGKGFALATLSGTPSWKNLYQFAAIKPNSNITASFWMKGSGKVRLRIMPRGDWSKNIAMLEFTATPTWTQYVLPTFDSGANESVVFCLQDISAVAGIIAFDDCFLGEKDGANVLANPGFESAASWTMAENIFRFGSG